MAISSSTIRAACLPGGVIVLLTFLAYLPAVRAGFLWDDDILITDNKIIQSDDGLYRFWFTSEATDYFPTLSSLFWVEWRLWGASPMGYHVVNILLHAANAILVWRVLKRLSVPGAFVAGLVFAVHPVNVASVAWISEGKNTLSLLFLLLSLLAYLNFETIGWARWYILSLLAFVFALTSKTSVVMFPFVLLIAAGWQRRRISRADVIRAIPFFMLALVFGLVTVWFQLHRNIAEGSDIVRPEGFASRLAVAGMAMWFYQYKAILPLNLNVVYPRWSIDGGSINQFLPGLLCVGLMVLLWRFRRGWGRPLFWALAFFAINLFPVLGFFDMYYFIYSLVADHWQYISVIGIIALVVGLAASLTRRIGAGRAVAAILACLVVAILSSLTWQRSRVFQSPETLWTDALSKNPQCWVAHLSIGELCQKEGKSQLAISHASEAVRLKPDHANAQNSLGLILAKAGRIDDAIPHFTKAVSLDPNYVETRVLLGVYLEKTGRYPEAIEQYRKALTVDPRSIETLNNLGQALFTTGKPAEAIEQFQAAIRIKPDFYRAHNNLGIVLGSRKNFPEAFAHYQTAMRLCPTNPDIHLNYGNDLVRAGKVEEGIARYEEAIRLDAKLTKAHNNLAVAYGKLGRLEQAAEEFRLVAGLGLRDMNSCNQYAGILIKLGRFGQAAEQYRVGLQIKPDSPSLLNNLSWLLATCKDPKLRDPDQALELAKRACRITNNHPMFLDTLAVAQAANGDFSQAVKTAERAVKEAQNTGNQRLAREILTRLDRYRSRRAYHE